MRPSVKQAWWFFSDRLYPRLQPLSEEQTERENRLAETETAKRKERVSALPDDETVLAAYLGECARLLKEEENTRRGIEGRLTSIIGLCSIAGTIVFGVILAQTTANLHVQTTSFRLVLAIGALYLTLQVCCAILASVRGLERRGRVSG